MREFEELTTRIKAVAFMTSSVLQSIANNGTPDDNTLSHVGITLEMELLNIANTLEVYGNEKNR